MTRCGSCGLVKMCVKRRQLTADSRQPTVDSLCPLYTRTLSLA